MSWMGGALSLPIVHKVAASDRLFITQDRLRIDATAEFYVRRNQTTSLGVGCASRKPFFCNAADHCIRRVEDVADIVAYDLPQQVTSRRD